MNAKEQLNQLSNDLEGYLNDYSGGITSKEDTISGLIDYVLERVKISDNFKLNKIIRKIKKYGKVNTVDEFAKKEYYYKGMRDAMKIIIRKIKKEITKKD